jgi:hypothetical protein
MLTIYLHLGKLTLKQAINARRYCSIFSLTSPLDEGGQQQALTALTPENIPGTHCRRGLMISKAGLDN